MDKKQMNRWVGGQSSERTTQTEWMREIRGDTQNSGLGN